MLKRDQPDPLVHERFERVWPAVDPLDPRPDRHGDQPAGLISRPPVVPPTASALAGLNPGRRAVRALVAMGLVVAAVAAFIAWRSQPRAEVVAPAVAATGVPSGDSTGVMPVVVPSLPASGSADPAMIVVAVTGRVHRPGLVYLAPGSRVADAIAAAGGALPNTNLAFVNLARKVSDGELIVIGVQPPPGATADPTGDASSSPAGAASGGAVDINTADLGQLQTLPGIGPALAQRIIDYRTQHGGFRSVDELQDVSGIGPSKFAAIKDRVTV